MSELQIIPYSAGFQDNVLQIAIAAWTPVFAKTKHEVPGFVYDAFYPQGWKTRQTADVTALLQNEPENFWLALHSDRAVGFVGLRMHPADMMGEILIIAVAPDHQRQGVGGALMAFAEQKIRAAGMTMVMVETVGDSGHAPARRVYEASGYEPWPVARYFKRLA